MIKREKIKRVMRLSVCWKEGIYLLVFSMALAVLPVSTQPLLAQPALAPLQEEIVPLEPLTITTKAGQHTLQVEVMRTEEGRMRGLMNRRYLPADRGMLFDFEEEKPLFMWMQNTYIPLDMLFIKSDGIIARIATDTEPFSTRLIPSGGSVKGVLELNAGTVKQLNLQVGDRIEHPVFKSK
jgi:uncharacterized protein